MVRLGRVRPGRQDGRKGQRLGALLAHELLQPPGRFALGHTGLDHLAESGEGIVDDAYRLGDDGQLVLIFQRPQLFHQPVSGDELDPRQAALLQALQPGVVTGDGHVAGLEANPLGAEPVQNRRKALLRKPSLDHDELVLRRLLRALGQVAEVAQQERLRLRDQQVPRRAAEAAQIAPVLRLADEQPIELLLLDRRANPPNAGGDVHPLIMGGLENAAYGLLRSYFTRPLVLSQAAATSFASFLSTPTCLSRSVRLAVVSLALTALRVVLKSGAAFESRSLRTTGATLSACCRCLSSSSSTKLLVMIDGSVVNSRPT